MADYGVYEKPYANQELFTTKRNWQQQCINVTAGASNIYQQETGE